MTKIIDQLSTHKHARIAYLVACIFAITIFTVGFFVPPMGKIDGSVLVAGGSVMIFTLAFIALAFNSHVKLDVDLDDRKLSVSTNKPQEEHEEN